MRARIAIHPGQVYVKDWDAYRASAQRLAGFAAAHKVSAGTGTHIEMSRNGGLFELGNTHQPNEAPLPLPTSDLLLLHERLQQAPQPEKISTQRFIVTPMSALQRAVSNVVGWFTR